GAAAESVGLRVALPAVQVHEEQKDAGTRQAVAKLARSSCLRRRTRFQTGRRFPRRHNIRGFQHVARVSNQTEARGLVAVSTPLARQRVPWSARPIRLLDSVLRPYGAIPWATSGRGAGDSRATGHGQDDYLQDAGADVSPV